MKHIQKFLLSAALLALPATMTAQNEITVYDSNLGQDEVFDLPEGMLVNEDSLLNEWQAKNYLFPDTTCENPNFNPEYAPEVYRERLQRLPTIIEMTYNDIVQKFIDRYTNRMRRQVSAMLGSSNLYVPLFEQALDFYGLPLELKYLPVIESAMNPKAVSPAGASGLWQFMLATGKRYGLKVNSLVDERRDPIKETWAAAEYMRDLFKIYGDWHLVLAAYNCGPGNVNKAIHRAGGERNYWKIYAYLPHETRGYVPAFIAANYIMNYYCDHNICPMLTKYPLQTDTVMVDRNYDMRHVAELCEIDIDVVKALNPQYKTNVIPGNSGLTAIRLPQESLQKFLTEQKTVTKEETDAYVEEHKEVALDAKAPAAQPEVMERKKEADKEMSATTSSTKSTRSSSSKKSTRTYKNTTSTTTPATTTTKSTSRTSSKTKEAPATTKSTKTTSSSKTSATTTKTSTKSSKYSKKKEVEPATTTKKGAKTSTTSKTKAAASSKTSKKEEAATTTSKKSSKAAASTKSSTKAAAEKTTSSKTAKTKTSAAKSTTSKTADTKASTKKSTTSSKTSSSSSKSSSSSSKSSSSSSKSSSTSSKTKSTSTSSTKKSTKKK